MMRRRIHACRVAMAAPPALYRGHIMRRRIHACIPLLAVCRKVEGVPVGVEFVSVQTMSSLALLSCRCA
jgi:hypothetical protein